VSALADREVGKYLSTHFVCSFQKIGTFRVVGGQKQGGNVASYFCTPAGGVLDAIPGPVEAAAFLREARWVVETRKMALLDCGGDMAQYQTAFRLAHAEQLPRTQGLVNVNWQRLPLVRPTAAGLAIFLEKNPVVQSLGKQDRVHLLLALYPLVKLDQAYKPVYEKILNEKVSTAPVTITNTATATPAERPAGKGVWQEPRLDRGTGSVPAFDRRRLRQLQDLRSARNNPPTSAVHSGRALNTLLADLLDLEAQGSKGKSVAVSAWVLKHVNLSSDVRGGNFGLLKNGGRLVWPPAWSRPPLEKESKALRGSVTELVGKALAQAKKGEPEAKTLTRLRDDVDELRGLLKKRLSDLPAREYINAKRHLGELDDALAVLEGGEAAEYVKGAFSLDSHKIKTVQDLVKFMKDRGLSFAPSTHGGEAAYVALRRALALADVSAQARATFDQGEM
jgi:hypothetical protein